MVDAAAAAVDVVVVVESVVFAPATRCVDSVGRPCDVHRGDVGRRLGAPAIGKARRQDSPRSWLRVDLRLKFEIVFQQFVIIDNMAYFMH